MERKKSSRKRHRAIPELLAPAGTPAAYIAAVEAGADAVYCGGQTFNARMGAGNFSDEELGEAIAFGHKRGVKTYITVNTLMTQEELVDALACCQKYYAFGADGVILQDLGLAALVRRHLPDLPIHLSTQGSVCDLDGVRVATRLGFSRVVTARELTLSEVAAVCQGTDTEIEVFVHGALCLCYSGQCQMSRSCGGRSGNRGSCAQPCRLPYRMRTAKGHLPSDQPYPLSPSDLCLLDYLPELAEAGVASLKIEGRIKSPEYIAVVVSLYRKYLDRYAAGQSGPVEKADRQALLQIFNRGGFTDGYVSGREDPELMSGSVPKHAGLFLGTVVGTKAGSTLVDIGLQADLAMGDGVEIRHPDGSVAAGNVVSYLKHLGGGVVRIGDLRSSVQIGDQVFRISKKSQIEEARRYYIGKDFAHGKWMRRLPVTCRVDRKGDQIVATAQGGGCQVRVISEPFPVEAGAGGDSAQRSEAAFAKMGSTPFALASFRAGSSLTDCDLRISAAGWNGIRRALLQKLEEALAAGRQNSADAKIGQAPAALSQARASLPPFAVSSLGEAPANGLPPAAEVWCFTSDAFAQMDQGPVAGRRYLLPARGFLARQTSLRDRPDVIPWLSNMPVGGGGWTDEDLATLARAAGPRGLYVGNLSWLERVAPLDVPVWGDFGLNLYNKEAVKSLVALGLSGWISSLEGVDAADAGAMPLMLTRHAMEAAELVDRKGRKFHVFPDEDGGGTWVAAAKTWEELEALVEKSAEIVSREQRTARVYVYRP